MSCVYLLTADKPLPLCDKQAERASTVMVDGKSYTVSHPDELLQIDDLQTLEIRRGE